jgi:hypothetical protein
MVIFPPRSLTSLAERIEKAYLRRCPRLDREYAHSGVWLAAAARLASLHRDDPTIPLDAELYVACQGSPAGRTDPWRELARPSSAQRYRRRVRKIVRQLRGELQREVRKAERELHSGRPLAAVLSSLDRDFSPLGRYLVAYRAGRSDLAALFGTMARDQHRACPLYQQACDGLIPPAAYPVFDLLPDWTTPVPSAPTTVLASYSLN